MFRFFIVFRMTLVEGTNDFSIVSKLSASSLGYFCDDFLLEMVDKRKRRAPLINWGYYLRFKSIEYTFEKAVSDLCTAGKNFQILSIGAGFDTTFFNVSQKFGSHENYHFFEIDLPSNVQRKTILIKRSEKCKNLLKRPQFQDQGGIISDNFTLFACDLANQKELQKKLEQLKFDFKAPTLILSECVITYMEERDSSSLIVFLANVLENAAFFVYEQIRPGDAFGKFMIRHFNKIGSPIKGVHKYFDVGTQCNRYLISGWEDSEAVTLAQVMKSIFKENKGTEKELERVKKLEPFDEFEELYLKSSHYLLVSSFKGSLRSLSSQESCPSPAPVAPSRCISGTVVKLKTNQGKSYFNMRRFGHTTAVFGNKIFCVGGFGVTGSSHERLGQVVVINTESMETTVVDGGKECARMYASSVCDENRRIVFAIGGRGSPKKGFSSIFAVDCDTDLEGNFSYDLPHPRWRHFSALMGDHLLCGGGVGGSGVLDVININTRSRIQSVMSQLLRVHSASAAVWKETETVIVTGGLRDDMEISDRVVTINLDDNGEVVVKKSDIKIVPRFSHTSHVVGDKLLIIGGVGDGDPPPCEVIDLVTGDKAVFSLPSEVEGELLMCHNHGSVIIDDTELWVVGGGGNCFSFGTHYNEVFKFDISKFLV